MAQGTHSLRIGGATAYANSPEGGEIFSEFVGLWTSSSKLDYLYACSLRIEAAGIAIARERGMEIAVRPGAVARYAQPGRQDGF